MRKFRSLLARFLKAAVPWFLGLGLGVTWLWTERNYGRYYVQDLVLLLVLLSIILIADSLEVAYSLLRYKDVEQFSGLARKVLEDIHRNEELVYEAREWLVTFLIVLITLRGEFPSVFVPWFGRELPNLSIPFLVNVPARTIFSLLFTTLPVLWFAQGPSKRLARIAPARVLEIGSGVWEFIKKISWVVSTLGLDKPAEKVAGVLTRAGGFRAAQSLKPSDYAFYIASVQRYGYALHDNSTHVVISADGSSSVTQRVCYYVLSRPCNVFVRKLKLDAPPAGFRILSLGAYEIPRISDTDPAGNKNDVVQALDALVEGRNLGLAALSTNLSVTPKIDPRDNRSHYRIDTHGCIPAGENAFALILEFQTTWSAGSFKSGVGEEDYFLTSFDCPTYRYRLTVETALEAGFCLGEVTTESICGDDPHWGESDRFREALSYEPTSPRAIHGDIMYPFPGIRYILKWMNVQPSEQPPPVSRTGEMAVHTEAFVIQR